MKNKTATKIRTLLVSLTLIVIVAIGAAGCSGDAEQLQQTTHPTEVTATEDSVTTPVAIESTEKSDDDILNKFFEMYNSLSDNHVSNLSDMDIQGDDYRTEFRLNAFENAVGKKGKINAGFVEAVNYGVWGNDSIRIYARLDSYDAAIDLAYDVIHVLDSTITDDKISEEIGTEKNMILGDKNQISGYISADYADGNVVGYDVMIDCTNIEFSEK